MGLKHRLAVLARGVGLLFLILALIALVSLPFRSSNPAHAVLPATSRAITVIPTASATPATTKTPRPARWVLSTLASRRVIDRKSDTHLQLRRAILTAARSSNVTLLIEVRLDNEGTQPAPYGPRSFYALFTDGVTVAATAGGPRPLHPGTLRPTRSVIGWLAFPVNTATRMVIIWDDHSRLIPPANLAKFSLSKG
ncbi:MAG: hypothetical protein ACRDFS_10160 [Chloroflexota bacterium]